MADDPQDVTQHAGQVVRRVLLRRNIVIDAETAQLVAAAVQAALQARHALPAAGPSPASSHRLRAAVLTRHAGVCAVLDQARCGGRLGACSSACWVWEGRVTAELARRREALAEAMRGARE